MSHDKEFTPEEIAENPIAALKVESIQALIRETKDSDLDVKLAWAMIGEILDAPGFTVYHVLKRQKETRQPLYTWEQKRQMEEDEKNKRMYTGEVKGIFID